jgi:hypothetical protein
MILGEKAFALAAQNRLIKYAKLTEDFRPDLAQWLSRASGWRSPSRAP